MVYIHDFITVCLAYSMDYKEADTITGIFSCLFMFTNSDKFRLVPLGYISSPQHPLLEGI